MTELLPIIEQLANARDHGERVEWLLQCPFGILGKYSFTIRNRLNLAGFPAGCRYVAVIEVLMQAVRGADGNWRPETAKMLSDAIDDMRAAVRSLSEAPGSVTDL